MNWMRWRIFLISRNGKVDLTACLKSKLLPLNWEAPFNGSGLIGEERMDGKDQGWDQGLTLIPF